MARTSAKLAAVAVWSCLVVLALSAPPSWADDAFAKITGSIQGVIQGDQTSIPSIPGSANAIQVFATSFGLANPPIIEAGRHLPRQAHGQAGRCAQGLRPGQSQAVAGRLHR